MGRALDKGRKTYKDSSVRDSAETKNACAVVSQPSGSLRGCNNEEPFPIFVSRVRYDVKNQHSLTDSRSPDSYVHVIQLALSPCSISAV